MASNEHLSTDPQPVIQCDSVFKIFGDKAKEMLAETQGSIVDAKTFQDAGCIVGVNNASFNVTRGEKLIIIAKIFKTFSRKSICFTKISRITLVSK